MFSKFSSARVLLSGFLFAFSMPVAAQAPAAVPFRMQALRAEANQPSVYEITITSPQVLEADAEVVL